MDKVPFPPGTSLGDRHCMLIPAPSEVGYGTSSPRPLILAPRHPVHFPVLGLLGTPDLTFPLSRRQSWSLCHLDWSRCGW